MTSKNIIKPLSVGQPNSIAFLIGDQLQISILDGMIKGRARKQQISKVKQQGKVEPEHRAQNKAVLGRLANSFARLTFPQMG